MTARSEDLAWAAGFFEGEGTFYVRRERGKPNATVTLTQVDREPLDRFCEIVGIGKVYGPYGPYSGNRKPYFQWNAHRRGDARTLLALLGGRLSQRRRLQAWDALIEEHLAA